MENNQPLVSICIPTSEMRGNGVKFIKDLLESIENQTYRKIEIIVSDHSLNDEVKNYVLNFQKNSNFVVKYFMDEKGRGKLANNLNNAMNNASGEYWKLIGQDDILIEPMAIELMLQKIQGFNWLACACAHFVDDINSIYNYHPPTWPGKNIAIGNNLIGAISVVMLKRTELRFDENLIWLIDCEFYFRLSLIFGLPVCLNELLVLIRHWKGSITDSSNIQTIHNKEIEYLKQKGLNI